MPLTSAYAVRGGAPDHRRPLCIRAPRASVAVRPRTGACAATDGAGGSGYADRPASFLPLNCHFRMSADGHYVSAGAAPLGLDCPCGAGWCSVASVLASSGWPTFVPRTPRCSRGSPAARDPHGCSRYRELCPSQLGHRVILVCDAYEWADDVFEDLPEFPGSPTADVLSVDDAVSRFRRSSTPMPVRRCARLPRRCRYGRA
jgi:hypothetical protein